MKADEQIYQDPMPYDPQGVIEWVPDATRVERCGAHTSEWIKNHCCRRLFRFRACRVMGGIVRATVCNRCTLEYDVIFGSKGERAQKLKELAAFCSCSQAEAMRAAQVRWAGVKRPEPPQPNRQVDLPYKDPE